MTAVHLPNDQRIIGQIPQLTEQMATIGYDGVWFGEVNNLDSVVPATLASTAHAAVGIGALTGPRVGCRRG